MSATFFGQRDLLPSVDQYWSDEDDDLEVAPPETELKINIHSESNEQVQPNRIFIMFIDSNQLGHSVSRQSNQPQEIGSIQGHPLQGRILICGSSDLWLQLDDLHLLRRKAQIERVLAVLGEKLHARFPTARVVLLGMHATYDEPLECFTSDDQLPSLLRPYQIQPPLMLCRNAEAALFAWRVQKQLPIDYYRLPRLPDQLPTELLQSDVFLPRSIRHNLWPQGGRQYLRASNNLYA